MPERPQYIVDATVIGKWFLLTLPDERYTSRALALLHDFQNDAVALFAPYQFLYEVPSILCKAIGGKRLSADQAVRAVTTFLSYRGRIRTTRAASLTLLACQQVIEHQCGFYDALYMALAADMRCPFIHADDKLRRTLRGRFPLELWIEDYQSA